jgi:multiple RNA-binding domain-containing protein 1
VSEEQNRTQHGRSKFEPKLAAPNPNPLKRKRDDPQSAVPDPILKEFIGVMQASAKTSTWQNDAMDGVDMTAQEPIIPAGDSNSDSEGELQTIGTPRAKGKQNVPKEEDAVSVEVTLDTPLSMVVESSLSRMAPKSDDDWLRSKTSRLLDLQDDEPGVDDEVLEPTSRTEEHSVNNAIDGDDGNDEEDPEPESAEAVIEREIVEKSKGRLYLRNLAFDVAEGDIRQHFSTIGSLEEVSDLFIFPPFNDEYPDRDILCNRT